MPSNYLRLYVRLIWKTWDHLPLITEDVSSVLNPVLLLKTDEARCTAIAIGGVEDHAHMLVSIPATICVSEILKAVKGASSRAIQLEWPERSFKWQANCGAITVSPSGLPRVTKYIENQSDHHRRGSLIGNLEAATEPD